MALAKGVVVLGMYFISTAMGDLIVSKSVKYSYLTNSPSTSSLLEVIPSTKSMDQCMMTCSRNHQCKAVVYNTAEDCSLYNSSAGSGPLLETQEAFGEVSRDEIRGSPHEVPKPTNPVTCTASTQYLPCENAFDGDNSTNWAARGTANSWILLHYERPWHISEVTFKVADGGINACGFYWVFFGEISHTFIRSCSTEIQLVDKVMTLDPPIKTNDLKIVCYMACPGATYGYLEIYEIFVV